MLEKLCTARDSGKKSRMLNMCQVCRIVFSILAMCLSQVFQLVGKVQLVSRHSSVADRLPVVRFPAGPRVRLKTADLPPVLLSFFPSTFAAVFAALQEALPLSCCSTCEMVAIVRISLQFLRIKPRFFVRKGSRSKQFS